LLRTFNPRSAAVLARTAELLAQEDAYLEAVAQQEGAALAAGKMILSIPALLASSLALQRRILKAWGQSVGMQLEAVHLAALERLIHQGQSGRVIELPGGWRVAREFEHLRLHRAAENQAPAALSLNWLTAAPLQFGNYEFSLRRDVSWRDVSWRDVSCIDAQQLMGNPPKKVWLAPLQESRVLDELAVRTRRAGDAYVPVHRHSPVKLKTLLIRHKIALSVRDGYPVLVTPADEIIWAPGLPVAADYVPLPNTQKCALVMVREA
jgi:tRNA(Ile)-lysidine synthetase-like protein